MRALAVQLVGVLGLCSLQSACGPSPETDDDRDDTVRIGALIPFTGELAASGGNIERAILFAAEKVNDEGGVAGRRVEIIARDSNSSVQRGMAAARELIEDENVIAIIGPQYEELAKAMMPLITEHEIITVSGGVTSPLFTNLDSEGYWFRTTPTAAAFGSVLADSAYADGARRLAILYVSDEYGRGFASSVRARFSHLEGTEVAMIPFASDTDSFRQTLDGVADFEPDAIALVAYPKTGAKIVSDWTILRRKIDWYFSNTLRADEFVRNVPTESIEGMTGTSHSLPPGDVTVFSAHFEDRWPGHEPLTEAFFNYDAAAVLLLAIEEAAVESGNDDVPAAAEISKRMESVSAPSGKIISWHDLARGLELMRHKDVPAYSGIDYRGVSGNLDLDERGDISGGLVQFWTVQNAHVVGGKTVTPQLDHIEQDTEQ